MRFVYFTHSLASCWNHGNAHFLRGVLRALVRAGHEVAVYEPADSWSRQHLLQDHGDAALEPYRRAYPELSSQRYDEAFDLDRALEQADVVIVHEWNEPWLVAAIGDLKCRGAGFALLFHDTHHRAVSDPAAIHRFDLDGYDAVLAFGETLADRYRARGWGGRAFVWHEAADTSLFKPPAHEAERAGIVWIGNWGDDERTAELEAFLFGPASRAGLPLDIHGVRYPQDALDMLARYGARYHGWLANAKAPETFARHLATIHVPRRFYIDALPGIPTIRVFEALACGIPLVCAPWLDAEGLFRPGHDYLVARDSTEMERHMRALANDPDLWWALRASGLEAIHARHSCTHRVNELLAIVRRLGVRQPLEAAL